jgi:LPXTG-site transpeptidase (sortase) family protein
VTWLEGQAGWLEGSAFPTWAGNSVLTGHVWDADNTPGIFYGIGNLSFGDEVIVHYGDTQYVYAVQQVKQVSSSDTKALLKHEERPWITLVTCKGYNESSGTYLYRILVRAVLVSIR